MVAAFLSSLSCWTLVAALIFGPWAYGSTRPECIQILNIILFLAGFFWACSRAAARRLPALPVPLLVFAGLILGQGWWMVFNTRGFIDPVYFQFVPGMPFFPSLPGSMDGSVSQASMIQITALLTALLVSVDLSFARAFRMRLLAAMILTATCLSLFAFWILHSNAEILSWPYGRSPFMFGPFRYHGNAGAYLNLVWPVASAVALYSFLRSTSWSLRILHLFCALTLYAAVAVNASKGGQIVAVALFCLVIVALIFLRRRFFGNLTPKKTALILILLSTLAGLCLAGLDLDRTQARWARFSENPVDQKRLGVAEVCVQMLPGAGFFGFGPQTFSLVFPGYNLLDGSPVPWFWHAAHQDYLQTVIEWGYLGTLVWTLLVVGGFFRLGYSLWEQASGEGASRLIIPLGILLSLSGVFLHSAIDFPLQVASLRLYLLVLLGMAWAGPAWIDERIKIRKKRKIRSEMEDAEFLRAPQLPPLPARPAGTGSGTGLYRPDDPALREDFPPSA